MAKKDKKSIRENINRRNSALDAIMANMPYQEKPKPGAKKVGKK
jgi:hypothetical protein